MYPMSKVIRQLATKRQGGDKVGWSVRGVMGDEHRVTFRRSTCHFEASPWGGVAYNRAEIFQQTSLSFHLPNADGGATPGRMTRTVMPLAITAPFFPPSRYRPGEITKRTRMLSVTQRVVTSNEAV